MTSVPRVPVRLSVNGTERLLEIDPRLTLLDALREELGLAGTKRGCDRGECGVCTVLLNGRSVYACVALAAGCDGDEVVTIEGLATPAGAVHPVQRAFVACDAVQCGYCTPGQILSAVALLREHPRPSDKEIASGMSGNLCRCGTYPKIKRAIRHVARGKR